MSFSDAPTSAIPTVKTPPDDGLVPWWVYMVQCADGTLYTGIAKGSLHHRLDAHNTTAHGAKYTRTRRPVRLVWYVTSATQGDALRHEGRVKTLTHRGKVALVNAWRAERAVGWSA